jgi:hypothetical protein
VFQTGNDVQNRGCEVALRTDAEMEEQGSRLTACFEGEIVRNGKERRLKREDEFLRKSLFAGRTLVSISLVVSEGVSLSNLDAALKSLS